MGFSFNKLAPDFKRLSPCRQTQADRPPKLSSFWYRPSFCCPSPAYVVYAIVYESLDRLLLLPLKSRKRATGGRDGFNRTRCCGAPPELFFVFGCVDLFREQRRFTTDLRMRKQEIKDEHKEAEGNPQTKMRMRRIQRDGPQAHDAAGSEGNGRHREPHPLRRRPAVRAGDMVAPDRGCQRQELSGTAHSPDGDRKPGAA